MGYVMVHKDLPAAATFKMQFDLGLTNPMFPVDGATFNAYVVDGASTYTPFHGTFTTTTSVKTKKVEGTVVAKAMWGLAMDGDDPNVGWYTTPKACALTDKGAKCLSLNSAELTLTPEVGVTNVQKMVLQLAGPSNLIIAAATFDTDLRSNSEEDNDRPHCVTSVNTVTCNNV
jgi:hypothetical protein